MFALVGGLDVKQVLVGSLRRGVALSTFQMVSNVMTDAHYNMPVALDVGTFYLMLHSYIHAHNKLS